MKQFFPQYLLQTSFQSVPMGSPLTFMIEGEDNENQIEVVQSSPDDYSPLEVKLISLSIIII